MPDLFITQALPNPTGKDRPPHGGPSNAQLNGEWLEFQNSSSRQLDLGSVQLLHLTFTSQCQRTGQESVTTFNGSLAIGASVRVHTGAGDGYWEGTLFHLFLGRSNYIWNNRCGDLATLATAKGTVDWAAYASNPGEGRVLRRITGTNELR